MRIAAAAAVASVISACSTLQSAIDKFPGTVCQDGQCTTAEQRRMRARLSASKTPSSLPGYFDLNDEIVRDDLYSLMRWPEDPVGGRIKHTLAYQQKNEFDQHYYEQEQRPIVQNRLDKLRGNLRGCLISDDVTLGDYDFQRHAFPVSIPDAESNHRNFAFILDPAIAKAFLTMTEDDARSLVAGLPRDDRRIAVRYCGDMVGVGTYHDVLVGWAYNLSEAKENSGENRLPAIRMKVTSMDAFKTEGAALGRIAQRS